MPRFSLFLVSLLILPLTSFADCPLGAKEDHLNVNRVMKNFGKATGDADYISKVKGKSSIETVTDAELVSVIAQLEMGISCAEQVLKDPTGDVLPGKLLLMTDEKEKAELVDNYIYFMTDFKDALIQYRDAFKLLLAQKPSERDFSDADAKRQDADDIVNRAHKKL